MEDEQYICDICGKSNTKENSTIIPAIGHMCKGNPDCTLDISSVKKVFIARDAIYDVVEERRRQDELWGEQNHEPIIWLGILMEEVGELSQQIIESQHFKNRLKEDFNFTSMREEAVQVAAVALAIVQSMDRNEDTLMH